MSIAGDISQLRNQQTLAMTSSSAAPAAAATAAAAPTADAIGSATGAAGDASMGAAAVQQPPNSTKVILQAVLKGALTGASVTMGLKQFGPFLVKIPGLGGLIGSLGSKAAGSAAAVAGKGLLGMLSKIPLLGSLLPRAFAGGIAGFAITALIGAAVGGIVGIFTGMKTAKAQTTAYNEAQAAQQAATPVGDPVTTADATKAPGTADGPAPAKSKAAPKGKWKSWVVAKHGTHLAAPGQAKTGHYNAKAGDTIALLAKRFYTTPAEIRKLNPGMTGDSVPAGTKVILARKVVPDAKAWVA
ncbi:MAG: LysM peptidoglycan-binding domain-containing protein [Thermoleophilia bacterium]|nr:LysM peptidoglycan-binding domain-containing protein [Thermoleophilia bacterium]